MSYKINTATLTIEVDGELTTPDIGKLLHEMVRYERDQGFKTFNWKFKNVKQKTTPTSTVR